MHFPLPMAFSPKAFKIFVTFLLGKPEQQVQSLCGERDLFCGEWDKLPSLGQSCAQFWSISAANF